MVQKPVQDGGGCRNIVQQLSPLFDGTIGGHHSGAGFIAAHDDLKKHFPRFGRQHLDAHIVNDQQIGLEIPGQITVQFLGGLIGLQLVDHVEDGTINDLEPGFDEVIADGLDQMALAQSRRPDQQNIPALANELAGGQFNHLLPFDGWIEGPVEVLQGFLIAKTGGFLAFINEPLLPDVEFILEDEFQELFVR